MIVGFVIAVGDKVDCVLVEDEATLLAVEIEFVEEGAWLVRDEVVTICVVNVVPVVD